MFQRPSTNAARPMARPQLPPGHPANSARVGQQIPGVANQGGLYPASCGMPAQCDGAVGMVGIDIAPELTWTRIGALAASQAGNVLTTPVLGTIYYATFTSRCTYTPKALYLEPYVTATGAAAPVDIVGIFSCTIDGQNLMGTAKDALANAGRIPSNLFSDPRQNCCPLFSIGQVPAMASLILAYVVRSTASITMSGAVIPQ